MRAPHAAPRFPAKLRDILRDHPTLAAWSVAEGAFHISVPDKRPFADALKAYFRSDESGRRLRDIDERQRMFESFARQMRTYGWTSSRGARFFAAASRPLAVAPVEESPAQVPRQPRAHRLRQQSGALLLRGRVPHVPGPLRAGPRPQAPAEPLPVSRPANFRAAVNFLDARRLFHSRRPPRAPAFSSVFPPMHDH